MGQFANLHARQLPPLILLLEKARQGLQQSPRIRHRHGDAKPVQWRHVATERLSKCYAHNPRLRPQRGLVMIHESRRLLQPAVQFLVTISGGMHIVRHDTVPLSGTPT